MSRKGNRLPGPPNRRRQLPNSKERLMIPSVLKGPAIVESLSEAFRIVQEMAADTLPREDIVPTAVQIAEGKIVDWRSENAGADLKAKLSQSSSVITRFGNSISLYTEVEAESALGILANDLESVSANNSPTPDDLQERWLKLMYGTRLLPSLEVKIQLMPQATLESKRYKSQVEEGVTQVAEALGKASIDDLIPYAFFCDAFHQYQFRLIDTSTRSADHPFIQAAAKPVIEKMNVRRARFHKAYSEAWGRLKEHWGWEQVQEILDALPNFKSDAIAHNLIAALESNFLTSPSLNDKPPADFELTMPGLLKMLKLNLEAHSDEPWLKTYFPSLPDYLSQRADIDGSNIPNKYFPLSVINLIYSVEHARRHHEAAKAISELGENVTGDEAELGAYVLLLISLRRTSPLIAREFASFVSNCKSLPPRYRQIILDQNRGQLIIDADGNLIVANSGQIPPGAFLVHNSKPRY